MIIRTYYLNNCSVIEEMPAQIQAIVDERMPMCRSMLGTPEFSMDGPGGIWRVHFQALSNAGKFEIYNQTGPVLEFIVIHRAEGMPDFEEFIRRFHALAEANAIPIWAAKLRLRLKFPCAAVIFHPAFAELDDASLGQAAGLQFGLSRAFAERKGVVTCHLNN
jgi:hypothetical protein